MKKPMMGTTKLRMKKRVGATCAGDVPRLVRCAGHSRSPGGRATTRQVRLHWNFGATGEAGAPENGENVPVQGLENERPLGFVGLRWTFEF